MIGADGHGDLLPCVLFSFWFSMRFEGCSHDQDCKEYRNLSRLHGQSLPILQVAEWQIQKGERIALMGASGCGKSTLLHLLSGVITADQGEIWVAGQPVHLLTESKRDRFRAENIGYIFQDFHLISSLTVRQNVEFIMPRDWTKRERTEKLDDWLERVGLQDRGQHLPSQLSRGQQQRAAIVRALITKPPLILADEPTGSLDWETASEMMSLLLEICRDRAIDLTDGHA